MQKKYWPGHLAAGLLGALAPLGFSPWEYWPLLIVIVAGLYCLFEPDDNQKRFPTKQAAWRALSFGTGFFGAGVSWVYVSIHNFGNAPLPLAAFLTVLFVIGLAVLLTLPQLLLYNRLAKEQPPWARVLLFSALWVLFEWVRSWLLTGFPWLYLGTALVDSPLKSWAPVLGVYGLSLIIVFIGATLAALLRTPQSNMLRLMAV